MTARTAPQRRALVVDGRFLAGLFALVDCAVLYALSSSIYHGYHAFWLASPFPAEVALVFCAAVAGTTALLIFERRAYEVPRLIEPGHVYACWRTWLWVMMVAIVIGFATKTGADLSRVATCVIALVGLPILSATHGIYRCIVRLAQRRGHLARRRAMLIGDPRRMAQFLRTFEADMLGIEMIGQFDVGLLEAGPGADASILGFARRQAVEEIFVALSWTDDERIARLVRGLSDLPVAVQLCPDRIAERLPEASARVIGDTTFLQLARPPLDRTEAAMKRCFDVVVAGLALVILAPLLAAIAVAVRLDSPGPALFRQRRYGFNRSGFVIFKFRTMTVMDDGAEVRQARRGDPRVTRLGRFLRRTSLDELPQLYNVLRGDMSLVGPRPHALAHDDYYRTLIGSYARRHCVRPGITGWAQVNGCRGETDTIDKMQKRIEFDLFYADNWSLALDLKILHMTVSKMWCHDAY